MATEKPKGGWYEAFQPVAEEIGVGAFGLSAKELLEAVGAFEQLWADPESGPWIGELLRETAWDSAESIEGPYGFEPVDLPALLSAPKLSPADAWKLAGQIAQVREASFLDEQDAPVAVRNAIVSLNLSEKDRARPRLVAVDKGEAFDFVREWHSALPEANYRGLLYSLGAMVGDRLVAVALINTVAGGWRREDCPQSGMIELSRIASDGTQLGASSMLASRAMDLLWVSARGGEKPCLFTTYSLLSEAGTTYLALADKGLRPVGITTPRTGPGRGESSLGDLPKIAWEYGPKAAPPDWSVMEKTKAKPSAVEGAQRAFEAWQARDIRQQVRKTFRGAKLPPIFERLAR